MHTVPAFCGPLPPLYKELRSVICISCDIDHVSSGYSTITLQAEQSNIDCENYCVCSDPTFERLSHPIYTLDRVAGKAAARCIADETGLMYFYEPPR